MKSVLRKISILMVLTFLLSSITSMGNVTLAADLTTGLVAHYTFDGNLNDSSGNGNNGTLGGLGITYTNAVVGNGAVFDGKSWVQVADSNSLDLTTAFTFSCWVYTNTHVDEQPIFTKGDTNKTDGNSPYGFMKMDNGGVYQTVRLVDQDEQYRYFKQSGAYSDIRKWELLTTTWDGTNVTFYVNGENKDFVTWEGTLAISASKLLIGKDMMSNTLLTGILDDLRIYNRVLADADIMSLYTTGKAGANQVGWQEKLVAHYDFNGNANDSSTYLNNGTEKGAALTYVNAVNGQGIKLGGSSWVEVAASDSLDISNAFTFSSWVYHDVSGDYSKTDSIFSKGESNATNNDSPYAFVIDNHYPGARVVNQEEGYRYYKNSDKEIDIQKWQFVTVTFDGTSITSYIDGVRKNSLTWAGPVAHSKDKLLIGKDLMEDTLFTGIIDELSIYNYCLSDAAIKALFDAGVATTTLVGFQKKMVAEYEFENNFADKSGYGNTASNVGGLKFTKAARGQGVKFNGKNYLEVKDSDSLDIDKAFTFSAWIYLDSTAGGFKPIFAKCDTNVPNRNNPYAFLIDGTNPSTRVTDYTENYRNYVNSSITLKAKTLYHLVATWDSATSGKNITYYVNGTKKDAVTWDGIVAHAKSKLVIGRDLMTGTSYFQGVMDDIRIYNYALTTVQAKALFKKDSFTLTGASTLKVKKSTQLKAVSKSVAGKSTTVTSGKGVTYKSSSISLATVSSSGKVLAKKKGTVTITATYGILTAKKVIKIVS